MPSKAKCKMNLLAWFHKICLMMVFQCNGHLLPLTAKSLKDI